VYALYFPSAPENVDSLDSTSHQVHLLYTYAMSLARFDTSYDLRDRARLLKNVHLSPLREAALFTQKPVPRMETIGEKGREWMLGSMAQVIGRDIPGQMDVPEWGSEIPEIGVRDASEANQRMATGPIAGSVAEPIAVNPEKEEKKKEKKVWKDLDKFYASESESELEEYEEEEAEEEEGESEEEEETEDTSEEDSD
jgi:AP-3 complex subunit beta